MADGNSIINLGDISRPATVLIEKICDAIGGIFRPYQIKRLARAEAEADIIRAQAQIEITELQRRALMRFIAEEAKKQDNIEKIILKAVPQLTEDSDPKNMEDDWIMNFFDKCRIISDEEMQLLWAKVLAGEANSPGKYSKRTVNLLGTLDKTDAQLFTSLCGFGWFLGDVVPLVYEETSPIYNDQGIDFNSLTHLDDIGLISFNPIAGFRRINLPKRIMIHYYGTPLIVEFKIDKDNELDIGKVLLTKAGQQIAPICGSKPVPGFFDYMLDRWTKNGLILSSPYPQNK